MKAFAFYLSAAGRMRADYATCSFEPRQKFFLFLFCQPGTCQRHMARGVMIRWMTCYEIWKRSSFFLLLLTVDERFLAGPLWYRTSWKSDGNFNIWIFLVHFLRWGSIPMWTWAQALDLACDLNSRTSARTWNANGFLFPKRKALRIPNRGNRGRDLSSQTFLPPWVIMVSRFLKALGIQDF